MATSYRGKTKDEQSLRDERSSWRSLSHMKNGTERLNNGRNHITTFFRVKVKWNKAISMTRIAVLCPHCHECHLKLTRRRDATHRHPQPPSHKGAVPAECRRHQGHQCLDLEAALERHRAEGQENILREREWRREDLPLTCLCAKCWL